MVSDEHPQDVIDGFMQLKGQKLIYYAGHSTLDGGLFFSWRDSAGIPNSWSIRPENLEYGPPDRSGTPFMIID